MTGPSPSIQRVAVVGASGYGGMQTLRLLQDHPHFKVSYLGGERSAGKRWSDLTPFLPIGDDLVVQAPDVDAIAAVADAAVLSLPNGLASAMAPALVERGVRVVDLSADYRFPSLSQWASTYSSEAAQHPRSDDAFCAEAVLRSHRAGQRHCVVALVPVVGAPGGMGSLVWLGERRWPV